MEDYYKILGIDRNASKDDIKRAYRNLAHKYHPDKAGGSEEEFKKINEAYQVLGDDDKRKQYDQFGRVFDSGFPGGGQEQNWGWNFDFSGVDDLGDLEEIFSSLFEGLGVKPKRRAYKRGADLEFGVEITLEEAQRGKVIELDFNTMVICETCKGIGHAPGTKIKKCDYCDGRGEVRESQNTFFGNFARVVTCKFCHGTGEVPEETCKTCKGIGRVRGKRGVSVEVRPGVASGQIIKINGMGEEGERRAGAGDLYVRVTVKKHPIFERRGNDLYRKVETGIVDVLLGKKLDVSTLDGRKVGLEVPRGFHLNEEIRI